MYGIDPSQRLRLLRHGSAARRHRQFHAELLRIFTDLLGDLHTNYILPRPYQGPFAFLGILLEQHWENGEPRWTGVEGLRCPDRRLLISSPARR